MIAPDSASVSVAVGDDGRLAERVDRRSSGGASIVFASRW